MKGNTKVLLLTIFLFGAITAAQFLAAFIARSETLLIDSMSMLVDTLTFVVSLCAAACHRDVAELTAAGLSLMILLGVSVWGIAEAYTELQYPSADDDLSPNIVLGFGIWGIVFDVVSLIGFYKWGPDGLLASNDTGSEGSSKMNLRSAFMHVGADLLRSVVIVGEGLAVNFEGMHGRETDSIAAMLVSATILLGACGGIVPWLWQCFTWRKRCAAKASMADVQLMAQRLHGEVEVSFSEGPRGLLSCETM